MKIGIIVADIDEYKPLKSYIEKKDFTESSFLGRQVHRFDITTQNGSAEVISILCGIGKVNAACAATHLAETGCDIILNYGLSGGISKISRGELCACDSFLEHDFDLTGIGYKPCEKPSQKYIYNSDSRLIEKFAKLNIDFKSGTAVTGDSFVCDENTRNYLKEEFSAMTCDMETAAIAYVCDASNIPYFSLRRVSDDAGDDAGDSYRQMNTSNETVLSDIIISFIELLINDWCN